MQHWVHAYSVDTGRSLNLTTGEITLLGVPLSVGATVAFGIKAEAWIRAVVGVATTVGLAVVVKLGTASGRGPIAQLAQWIIGSDQAVGSDEGDDELPRTSKLEGSIGSTRGSA